MKHKILLTSIAAALLTFTVPSAVYAADPVTTSKTDTEQATADAQFMHEVIRGGLTEIKAAEIAMHRTGRDDVKEFAKTMAKDHADVNKNLKTLADRMKMKLPTDYGDHQAFLDGLKVKAKENAPDFDRTYVAESVAAHERCVAMFEKFSGETKNADLKAFADNTLPGLRTHLKRGIDLLAVLGAAAAK
jgi:putative membrane protein